MHFQVGKFHGQVIGPAFAPNGLLLAVNIRMFSFVGSRKPERSCHPEGRGGSGPRHFRPEQSALFGGNAYFRFVGCKTPNREFIVPRHRSFYIQD